MPTVKHAGGVVMVMTEPGQGAKTEVPIAVKSGTETILVPLDTPERLQLANACSSLHANIEHLTAELKEAVAAQRSHIATLKATLRDHLRTLAKGAQEQLVDVETHYDFNTEMVRVVYKGKLLKERAMTAEEKQLDLDLCLQMGYELKAPKAFPHSVSKGTGVAAS